MKAKTGFNLREVCGEQIIVAEGEENIDFSNIISMNESAAYLWKILQSKDSFTVEDMTQLLLQEYEVEEEMAKRDATILAAQWAKAGIIIGDDIPDVEVQMPQPSQQTSSQQQPEEKKGFFGKLFKK